MRVLIFGEFSGRVREAFRKRGHDAWSVDLLPSDDNSPYHHIGDGIEFMFMSEPFDLVIGHPPCTFLCQAGVRWMYNEGRRWNKDGGENRIDEDRWRKMHNASNFFNNIKAVAVSRNRDVKIAIENPEPHPFAKQRIGSPTQCVQPWWFGDKAFKATCLWLWNLPPLVEGANSLRAVVPKVGTPEYKEWSALSLAGQTARRAKDRSVTFQGIANAMAEQWG